MKLGFRPFERRDIATLKSWFPGEEDVLQWAGASLTYPVRDRDMKAWIKAHNSAERTLEAWSAEAPDGALCGHVQIWFDDRLRQATIGRVAIAPERRGGGLSHQVIDHAISRSLARPEVNRLELRVYDHNTTAIAAYVRAGFVHEGLRRQSTPVRGGFWNTAVMSLLREEFDKFDKRTERE